MPGRKYSTGTSYRYGFNGKENDNEVKGEGNQIAFEARIYDPRLGRFLSCDPLERTYPSQSTYVFAHNNPIKLIDILGMGGGDPTPVYHRTSSAAAASISQNGFDPGKSNRNGFTYFSTTPEGGSIGTTAASGNTVVNATVDISGAKTITKQQMSDWFNDGFATANKQLNTKYSSMADVPKELQPKYQSIADGVRNTKLADFMQSDGGAIYNIAGKNTIAVSEGAIRSVDITKLTGSGAAEAVQMMSRPALNGEAAAALREYGKAVNTIKWGGKACIAIAVAADIYEIYQSDDRSRTITKTVGGWSGGLGMGAWGAAAGIETGPGAIMTGIIGFGIGYFVGSKTTEMAYDYLFTKGVSAK